MPYSPLTFPFRGLDDNVAFGEQRADTTRDAQNVRGVDPVTGRVRGAQRSGLSKQYTNAVNGTNPVKAMELLVYDDKQVDYADLNNGGGGAGEISNEWARTPINYVGLSQAIVDSAGDIYALGADSNAFYVYSAAGVLLATQSISVTTGSPAAGYNGNSCEVLAVDDQGDVWIGVSENVTAGEASILRYSRTGQTTWELIYTIPIDLAGSAGQIKGIEVKDQRLYASVENGLSGASALAYLMIWDGIYGGKKPSPETVQVLLGTNSFAHGIAVSDAGEVFVTYTDSQSAPFNQHCEKFNSSGESVWELTDSDGGGTGLAVAVKGAKVWTLGFGVSGDNVYLAEWLDSGSTVANTWQATDSNAIQTEYRRIIPDAFDNIHVPIPQTGPITTQDLYRVHDSTGSVELSFDNVSVPLSSVALPPTNPSYDGSVTEPTRPEFAYVTGIGTLLTKLRLVSATATSGSVRTMQPVGICNNTFRKLADTSTAAATDTSTFSSILGWYGLAVMNGEVFTADGINYNVFNPQDDEIKAYAATSNGSIPPRCKLIAHWNERMVLARNADDAHNIFMSAKGDPYDWDFAPWTPLTTSAVAFNNQESLGPVAGIINTLIPYSDEMLIVGCDHEIWMLNGDPGAGGYLGLISDTTGMSFGDSWCKDPSGNLYFFGSKGGVYRMNPYGEAPVRISNSEGPAGTNIERRLAAINLTTYHVRLVWNWEDDGLMVMLLPFGAGAVVTTNFFWERRTGAWHEDTFGVAGNTVRQPHSMAVLDGDDPDDRVVLFGCEDGFVRKWDRTATDDDGLNIASTVLMGPVLSSSADEREVKFKSLTAVLADDQSGCNYEVLVNDRADVLPVSAQRSGSLQPGRNPTIRLRERGKAAYVRLQDAGPGRWALENIRLEGTPGGRERLRT